MILYILEHKVEKIPQRTTAHVCRRKRLGPFFIDDVIVLLRHLLRHPHRMT